ncbi:MAG: hypothetical protein WC218_09425 [Candidatus Cloacimonadales bacterium]|jgi:superfamily II helicase
MYLAENHLEKAKEIALNNRKKRTCKKCYDRGYIGLTPENTLVICEKCVNVDAAMEEWKEYVKQDPQLMDDFKDLFEEEEEETESNESTVDQ